MKEEIPTKPIREHTMFGIASLASSIAALFTLVSAFMMQFELVAVLAFPLFTLGFILGIIGLCTRHTKKITAIIGLILNCLPTGFFLTRFFFPMF